jgi:hypothetical protein
MIHQQQINLHLVTSTGINQPVHASFSYASDDPYAIRLGWNLDTTESAWILPRNLLWYAMQLPGPLRGEGDVKAQVDGDYFRIFLDSEQGTASIRLIKYDLIEFICKTLEIVPLGDELPIVEAELDDVLAMILSEEV